MNAAELKEHLNIEHVRAEGETYCRWCGTSYPCEFRNDLKKVGMTEPGYIDTYTDDEAPAPETYDQLWESCDVCHGDGEFIEEVSDPRTYYGEPFFCTCEAGRAAMYEWDKLADF